MRIGVVSIQKNRAPWVHEWVAFHHLVGVSRFYVYAHNCTDGTDQVLQQLAAGYDLKAYSVRTDENRIQLKTYQHALETHGHECDWLAFIDGDEFLFPTAAPRLQDALAPFEYQRVSAVGVYWACFGSSGHVDEPAGLVVQNYRRRAPAGFEANRHIKSIVRGRQGSSVGVNSHLFRTPWGTVDELSRPVTAGHTEHTPSYATLRINHYVCQSLQYFRQFKQRSGAADAGAAYVRPDDWWTRHDRNDELDHSLEHLMEPLAQEVRRVPVRPAASSS